MESDDPVTRILRSDTSPEAARAELLERVYDELRSIAARRLSNESPGHTLQATALVNEAYCRLVGDRKLGWEDRNEFFSAASEAMRRVLLDHARRRQAHKRGGRVRRAQVTLSSVDLAADCDPDAVRLLDEAMSRLAREEPRAHEVVRLRYFGGLDVAEVAEVLGISVRTVMREWAFARARLYQLVEQEDA